MAIDNVRDRSDEEPVLDDGGLEILDAAECLRLLGSVPVGRMVFSEGGLPAVHPVNFAIDDDSVVFRVGPGSKWDAAARGDVVAFEVDEFDTERHGGWSVTVIGHASLVSDSDAVERLPVRPWAPGERPEYVRVDLESVHGRRILPWGRRRRR